MELAIILKALFSLGVVFFALYFILKIVQRYTKLGTNPKGKKGNKNLAIENLVYIDENTKLVNISNNKQTNYIIAISKNNLVLIDKYKTNQE
ncbi:MAG: hypothetical protein HRU35_00445 [Rickettsiaceae bacterium]|nr:hypothetical protein [Rickettsiaceae bacterium]